MPAAPPLVPRLAARTRHVCAACEAVSPKWQGQCPVCHAWNTIVERVEAPAARRARSPAAAAVLRPLTSAAGEAPARLSTGLAEVDRVLGGGLVPGSLVLLGGDPGIGKSTLALGLAHRLGSAALPALYCAGEESAAQLELRARRTGCAGPGIAVVAETDLDTVLATIEAHQPALAIVDSVQTLHDPAVPGGPGSISQVREAVVRLLLCAKSSDTTVVLVGHVTKEGAIAGPRTLEHMVDVVLYLEGERHGDHRLLRGVKNRFGATDELGVLVLDEAGMREAPADGRAFVEVASLGLPGTMLTVTGEGSRPLVVEVQALVAPIPGGLPRRTASGFDLPRLHVLLAVLGKRANMALGQADVYLNAVGGVRISEPAADLAAVLAIASAARDQPIPAGLVAVGEVGLSGEVRRVRRLDQRLTEVAALGLPAAVVPAGQPCSPPDGLRIHPVASLADALEVLSMTV